MISPEACIYHRLVTSPAVFALVGNRIEPSMSSENTQLPRAVYTRLSGSPEFFLQGESGIGYYTIQFDIFASSYAAADAVGEAFRNRLSGFRGVVTVGSESRRFHMIKLEATRDNYVPPFDGSDTPVYRRSMDFIVSTVDQVPQLTA